MLESLWMFLENFSNDPFVQLTGISAMLVTIVAYLQKDDFTVKKLLLLSTLLWGTHFYLLWMYTGLAANAIWIVRFSLSAKYGRSKNAFLFVLILTFVIWYFTVDRNSILSTLPIIASIIWAFSYFFLEKISLRLAMLLNSAIWVVYHSYIGSITWILNNLLTECILLFTIYRMMHPMGGTSYYAQKIKEILWKRHRPDYDTFIFIYDKVSIYRKHIWTHFLKILHYDLRKFLPKKKWIFARLLSHKKKEMSVAELIQ